MNKLFISFLLFITISHQNIFFEKQEFSKAYFASGCFWCVESIYENLKGVINVDSGYSGGSTINPTYYQVISGNTGHAETIEVIYDSSIIDFKTLVNVFFGSHDPSTLNRQGPDVGTQYRSVAVL
jgi:peptide-methionine (S)-S-oxide reductase